MRFTVILLLTACLQLSAKGFSQSVTLSEKNAPLGKIFRLIKKQTGYAFFFDESWMRQANTVTIDVKNAPLQKAMDICFTNQPLSYFIVGTTIVVKPKEQIRDEKGPVVNAPPIEVKGVVTNEDNVALQGVSVIIKGSDKGTVTDANGNFTIQLPDNGGVLVISYVGYEVIEARVNKSGTLNFSLKLKEVKNEEVVVTALGIRRESKSLTYSTQGINAQQVKDTREPNMLISMQGKVAGLSITESGGGLGSPARVILRGNRSIFGDSQPLYVIDGVPINGDPTNLSSDNIASINVLKGPNAAALYGSAAQNGAIIITTYSGNAKVTNVSFSSSIMTQRPVMSARFQNEYGQGTGGAYNKRSDLSWGPKMEGQMVEHWSPDPAHAGEMYAMTPQPDNVTDFFHTGKNFVNNLLVNMGGEKTQTVFSFTRTDANGMVPNNELKRNNISLRTNTKLFPGLSLDTKIDYTRQDVIGGINSQGTFESSIQNLYNMPRSIQTAQVQQYEYIDQQGANRQNYWLPNSAFDQNPYWRVYRNPTKQTDERIIALASLRYDFTRELSLMVRAAYDGGNSAYENKTYNDTYNRGMFGRYTVSSIKSLLFNTDFLLSYKKNIHNDWSFDASLGGNMRKNRNSVLYSNTGVAMTVPNFFALSNTQQVVSIYNPGNSVDVNSLYAFANIGWKSALFLDVTGRNDWSSTLPAANRSYFYPSVGLSAVLTDLFPDIRGVLSFAKVRGSWAQVGNSAPPYLLQRSAAFSAGGYTGFLTLNSTLPDTALTPELTKSLEFGADLRFFNGRFGVDFTLYKTNTTNQLFTVNLPVGSGAAQYFTNGGNIQNKGIEVLVTVNPIRRSDFNWDVNLNYSMNRNLVLKINDQRPRVDVGEISIEQGKPFGNIYRRGFLRDDKGNVIIGPDGVPKSTPGATVLVANFNPDWMGSILNTFSYKNLTLSVLIDHRQGGTILSQTNARLYGDGHAAGTVQGREGGLIFGQNFFPNEKAVLEDGSKNNIAINAEKFWSAVGGRTQSTDEIFAASATNTRVRELIIGYSLPTDLSHIARIHFSIVGRNLFFIHRASNTVDPDLRIGTGPDTEGISGFALPTARTFGGSIKVDLK